MLKICAVLLAVGLLGCSGRSLDMVDGGSSGGGSPGVESSADGRVVPDGSVPSVPPAPVPPADPFCSGSSKAQGPLMDSLGVSQIQDATFKITSATSPTNWTHHLLFTFKGDGVEMQIDISKVYQGQAPGGPWPPVFDLGLADYRVTLEAHGPGWGMKVLLKPSQSHSLVGALNLSNANNKTLCLRAVNIATGKTDLMLYLRNN